MLLFFPEIRDMVVHGDIKSFDWIFLVLQISVYCDKVFLLGSNGDYRNSMRMCLTKVFEQSMLLLFLTFFDFLGCLTCLELFWLFKDLLDFF